MPEPPELLAFKERFSSSTKTDADASCGRDMEFGVSMKGDASQSKVTRILSNRLPFFRLLNGYWDSLSLQVMFIIWYSLAYYAFSAWLPSFYNSHGVAALTTQGMQMASQLACGFTAMLVGYFCDKGLPCMQTFAATILVSQAKANMHA